VREQKQRRKAAEAKVQAKAAPAKTAVKETGKENGEQAKAAAQKRKGKDEERTDDERRQQVLDLAVETVEALIDERGGDEKIWGSMVKQTMKRRRPGFNEAAYGYRSFRALIEDAQKRHLLVLVPDEKTGQYTVRLPAGEE
jgi:hypothetical protein